MTDLPTFQVGGRLAARFDGFPLLERYTVTVPAPVVYPIDVSGGVTSVPMLGNGPDPTLTVHDGIPVPCCVEAAFVHARIIKAANTGDPYVPPSANDVVTGWLASSNGQGGTVVSAFLLSQFQQGNILGFARVDHTDREACDQAMRTFHGLYVGGTLPADADTLYGHGETWTVANGETPDPAQSHCWIRTGSDGVCLDHNISWTGPVSSTWTFSTVCVDEAWVFITVEDEAANINLGALIADLDTLGGTTT